MNPDPCLFQLLCYDSLDYGTAWELQKNRVEQILSGKAPNLFLLLEHTPVYTIGRSGKREEILSSHLPVHPTDRGGKVTYHGPGQSVGYVVCDLRPNHHAVRDHVRKLEETVLRALSACGVQGAREADNPGVWVDGAKIGALGVRIRQGVAYHGFAVNRALDLAAFRGIVPCGLPERGVTSLARLGIAITRAELEEKILQAFKDTFWVDWIRE